MRFKHVVGLALLGLSFAQPVHASPLFELLGGFGGQGALQARHAGPSAASAYFNPALLPDAPSGLSAGVLILNTEIGVRVDARPPGHDVPDIGQLYNAQYPGTNGARLSFYPLPTDWLQNGRPMTTSQGALAARPRQQAGTGHQTNTYEAVGLVVKFFQRRVAFGLYALIPNVNFSTFTTFYSNEKEQFASNSLHPELYDDRLKAVSLAFALGGKVTDTLSVGLGATLGLGAVAGAKAYVASGTSLDEIKLNINADAKITLVPHGGFSWEPGKRWHLTGTVHAPQKLDIKAGFGFLLGSGQEQSSSLAFTHDFMPWQAGAGLGYDIVQQEKLSVTATASMLYGRWSKYIDRQSTRPSGAYEWNDTVSGAAGLRMVKGPLSMALDGQYKPTPVPLQTGRYNYVDNDRLGLALAVDYGFELMKLNMKLGVQLQGYRLIERRQTKLPTPVSSDGVNRTPQLVRDELPDNLTLSGSQLQGIDGVQTNNPGWPGFSSAGWISSAGLYLTVVL